MNFVNHTTYSLVASGTKRGKKIFFAHNIVESLDKLDDYILDVRTPVQFTRINLVFYGYERTETHTIFTIYRTLYDWADRLGYYAVSIVLPAHTTFVQNNIQALLKSLSDLYHQHYIGVQTNPNPNRIITAKEDLNLFVQTLKKAGDELKPVKGAPTTGKKIGQIAYKDENEVSNIFEHYYREDWAEYKQVFLLPTNQPSLSCEYETLTFTPYGGKGLETDLTSTKQEISASATKKEKEETSVPKEDLPICTLTISVQDAQNDQEIDALIELDGESQEGNSLKIKSSHQEVTISKKGYQTQTFQVKDIIAENPNQKRIPVFIKLEPTEPKKQIKDKSEKPKDNQTETEKPKDNQTETEKTKEDKPPIKLPWKKIGIGLGALAGAALVVLIGFGIGKAFDPTNESSNLDDQKKKFSHLIDSLSKPYLAEDWVLNKTAYDEWKKTLSAKQVEARELGFSLDTVSSKVKANVTNKFRKKMDEELKSPNFNYEEAKKLFEWATTLEVEETATIQNYKNLCSEVWFAREIIKNGNKHQPTHPDTKEQVALAGAMTKLNKSLSSEKYKKFLTQEQRTEIDLFISVLTSYNSGIADLKALKNWHLTGGKFDMKRRKEVADFMTRQKLPY